MSGKVPKGRPGFQRPSNEMMARAERTRIRIVKRKLSMGRPGREAPTTEPSFSWEKVVNASQKERA